MADGPPKGKLSAWLGKALERHTAVESAPSPAPLPAPEAPPADPVKEAERESRRRLGFITAYAKDDGSNPDFVEKGPVVAILTDERAYQQAKIRAMEQELRALPPAAAAMGLSAEEVAANETFAANEAHRQELEKRLTAAKTRHAQIYNLLKRATGKTGKTGGTGFLGATQPTTAPSVEVPLDDVLDDLFGSGKQGA
ncbi:MAG: hypothetical protein JWM80_1838 [Cyanobacteria bacterium RYN_339]|nr:hypothetical protein [Cyanobacteria bacterium RYN_339]